MTLEKRIELLLKEMSLEDILEQCDITPEEVLEFLVNEGFIQLPEWTPEM